MWQYWRPIFGWKNLCPIYFADPLGMFVIMPKAKQPVTFDDVITANSGEYDYYPAITAESKTKDWGCLGSRVVALDYGLAKLDMVVNKRRSYKKHMRLLQKGRY